MSAIFQSILFCELSHNLKVCTGLIFIRVPDAMQCSKIEESLFIYDLERYALMS